ncbi:hypothetical protein, partial [Streptomyces sp. NPDC007205]|uniref:hypothetical protein n=1 Tax=Streptomyces sp. NPDC007205 TaxID=3154316 RepID=UPI003402FC87
SSPQPDTQLVPLRPSHNTLLAPDTACPMNTLTSLELDNRVIETSYNRRRLRKHKVFGYLTPAETRQRHQHDLAA